MSVSSYIAVRILVLMQVCVFISAKTFAQEAPDTIKEQSLHFYQYKLIRKASSIEYRTFCKNYLVFSLPYGSANDTTHTALAATNPGIPIHGNIYYDYNYRSQIDTPFQSKNFQQHYVRSDFSFTVARKYPVQLSVVTRVSNSVFFKNEYAINLQFNRADYIKKIKEDLFAHWFKSIKQEFDAAEKMKATFLSQSSSLNERQHWLEEPKQLQRLIEAKEYLSSLETRVSSLPQLAQLKPEELSGRIKEARMRKFSSPAEANEFIDDYKEKKKSADSLKHEVEKVKQIYLANRKEVTGQVNKYKSDLNNGTNFKDLKNLNAPFYDSLSQWQKFMLGLRNFSAGRSIVDYSELTAKNVSLTGFNIEYSGRYYWALAAGSVDYRFQDFTIRQPLKNSQYLSLLRFGKGNPEQNHVIFTLYNGIKNNYNFQLSQARQPIYGIALENKWQLNPKNYIQAEIAKSSTLSDKIRNGSRNNTINFTDNTTTALYFKMSGLLEATHTRINASYKYTGRNFQSFTLYSPSSNQTSWNIYLEQSLFKKALSLKAGLKKNQFNYPAGGAGYNSNTVFKSAFISFKKNRLPYFSLSYSPTAQVTRLNNIFYENQFYMLSTSVSHSYRIGSFQGSTLLIASKYYTLSSDTSFIYANSKNIFISQNLAKKNVSLSTSISWSNSPDYRLYTLDNGLTITTYKGLAVGGGIKINILNREPEKIGQYYSCTLPIKGLGDVSLSYEGEYLPGFHKDLIHNDMGRITYFKRF